ncbi:MAG: thiamine phosphate synthase [Akkermansia sp.]|jgi:thiamine-phosphate pyrophosphorylase|nr:thiamine phosphate synthase [Akkermansia sp.]
MSKKFDLNLYLVTDAPERCRYGLLETVRRAVAGGVSIVQYRRDLEDHAAVLAEVLPLRDFLRGAGVPLIINNDVELAVEIGADGIHIGQSDMPVAEARALIGPEMILGLTVANDAEMDAVDATLVDYVGCGPVFPTISKDDAPADLGVAKWAELAARCPVPICAIGGLDVERSRAVRATGHCDGIAVVSAICAAEDPEQAARNLV